MKRDIFTIGLLSVALLLGCWSCSEKEQIDLTSEKYDKFTTVYAELSTAFELAQQDSNAYFPLRDSILEVHNVDTAWVNGVINELGDDSEVWYEVWQEITRKLEAKKDSLTP